MDIYVSNFLYLILTEPPTPSLCLQGMRNSGGLFLLYPFMFPLKTEKFLCLSLTAVQICLFLLPQLLNTQLILLAVTGLTDMSGCCKMILKRKFLLTGL